LSVQSRWTYGVAVISAVSGALADGVNIATAVGTVAAAGIAEWLGLRANRDKERERDERAMLNARQVVAVVRRTSPADLSTVPPYIQVVRRSR
jgi:hypothetical protein